MIVKLLAEHHLEFLSLKGGCRGSSESTVVKMSNCWKCYATAHIPSYYQTIKLFLLYSVVDCLHEVISEHLCLVYHMWCSLHLFIM